MLHPPEFYYVKKTKRFVILSSDKSSEHNLSCFFDIIKPRRMEHLQSEEPFSSDPYFRTIFLTVGQFGNKIPFLFVLTVKIWKNPTLKCRIQMYYSKITPNCETDLPPFFMKITFWTIKIKDKTHPAYQFYQAPPVKIKIAITQKFPVEMFLWIF